MWNLVLTEETEQLWWHPGRWALSPLAFGAWGWRVASCLLVFGFSSHTLHLPNIPLTNHDFNSPSSSPSCTL
jgi:hypothetical protein